MGVDRFYCPEFQVGQSAQLEGDEARHLAKVRRVAVGADVEIFNGRGLAAVAEVMQIARDRVTLAVRHRAPALLSAPVRLTLATAIPKGERFDWLIEKATELGVDRVVPLMTERSTVDPRTAKLDRLRRSIIEASKQCRRNTLMALEDPITWNRWISQVGSITTHRWIAHPGGSTAWNTVRLDGDTTVAVAIGPEGGLTDEELTLARSHGWAEIDLTATILRIETAGLAVAAHVLLRSHQSSGGPETG